MSINKKLSIILAVMMILATVGIVFMRVIQQRNTLNTQISSRLQAGITLSDEVFDVVRNLNLSKLEALSNMPPVQAAAIGGDYQLALDVLESMWRSINFTVDGVLAYANITMFDAQLDIVTSANPTTLTNALTDTEYFENIRAAQAGRTFVSDVSISPVTGLTQFWFTHPIMIENSFAGMLALPVNTQAFGRFIGNVLDEDAPYIAIADATGAIFFSNLPDYANPNLNIRDIGIDTSYVNRGMFIHTSAVTEMEMMALMDVCSAEGWIFLAFFDRSVVDDVSMRVFRTQVPTVLAILLAMVIFLTIIRYFLKPLDHLAVSAREIARGNIDINLKTNSNDEVGQVFKAFAEIV